jgi:outer membrane protein assembly factor BamA
MLALIVGFVGMMGSSRMDTVIVPAVDSSRVLTVNRIIIIGNKVTKERIISRELTLKHGDTISLKRLPHELLWDKRKIYNLRLFHMVTVRSLELSQGVIDLLVEVTERWYTFPIPIFELSDRNFSEWWQNYNHDLSRINYGVNLTRYNFRGRNETVQLILQFGFTQRYELSYRIPYIDKKQKQGIGINLDYSEPKNLAYFTDNHILQYLRYDKPLKTTKGASFTYFYRKSFFETHSFQVGYRDSQIRDTIAILNPNYFGANGTRLQLQYGFINYSFNSEHRDVVQYPLRGFQIAGYVQKTGFGGSSVDMIEGGLSYAYHAPLKKNLFFSNYTGGYATTQTQPYALYSGMGYRKQLVRGFETNVIEAPWFVLNKTTLKTRIFHKAWNIDVMPKEQLRYFPLSIYWKVYTDWGYAENFQYYMDYRDTNGQLAPLNTRLTNKVIGSWGTGFDFVTVYDMVIRTEFTFTSQHHQGFFLSLRKEF